MSKHAKRLASTKSPEEWAWEEQEMGRLGFKLSWVGARHVYVHEQTIQRVRRKNAKQFLNKQGIEYVTTGLESSPYD